MVRPTSFDHSSAQDKIREIIAESVSVKEKAVKENLPAIVCCAEAMASCLKAGGKILFCGNGGSAADSQHIAAEFVGRFQKERRALAAMALTTDTSILTALANDYSYDIVFARQVEALGRKGDVLVGISTSGKSVNVLKAFEQAKGMGLTTVAFSGKDGGPVAKAADISIVVAAEKTARIQESHITIAHAICEVVEDQFVK